MRGILKEAEPTTKLPITESTTGPATESVTKSATNITLSLTRRRWFGDTRSLKTASGTHPTVAGARPVQEKYQRRRGTGRWGGGVDHHSCGYRWRGCGTKTCSLFAFIRLDNRIALAIHNMPLYTSKIRTYANSIES